MSGGIISAKVGFHFDDASGEEFATLSPHKDFT
jgi:hypothetical protein